MTRQQESSSALAWTAVTRAAGFAGTTVVIGLSVKSGVIKITSFQVDTIFGTIGGDFAQYASSTAAMTGAESAGNMTLTLTGRQAAINAPVFNTSWNVNGSTTTPFTSGTACNSLGCITGNAVTPVPGTPNYRVTLVSAGVMGADWGLFAGTPYFEIWNSQSTIFRVSEVPLPGAAWLLGSGLLGLMGVARRKAA